jgi:hypothetical protein
MSSNNYNCNKNNNKPQPTTNSKLHIPSKMEDSSSKTLQKQCSMEGSSSTKMQIDANSSQNGRLQAAAPKYCE